MAGNFQWDQGALGGLGLEDLKRARASGISDKDILSGWLGTGIPIGERARAELQRSLQNKTPTPTAPKPAPAPSSPAPSTSSPSSSTTSTSAPDNSAQLLAYQRELDTYRSQVSANSFKLADYESQLNRYKTDLETSKTQYSDVLGKYNESTNRISSLGQELEKVKADAELNRSNLEAYKKDTVSQQLDVLRRGSGTSTRPSTGQADLTSGGTAVTRTPRQGGVNIVAKVDASDSVLDRKGPVVDVMQGGGPNGSHVQARQRAVAASQGGSAAGYYASRFG